MPATRALAALLLTLTACSDSGSPDRASVRAPIGSPTPRAPVPESRSLTRPEKVVVDNLAEGRYARIVERSLRDLKRIGVWKRLTRELFVLEVSARAGARFIPEDGHLADAFRTLDIRGERGGVLCDVTFYPSAMTADLRRWRGYYAQGLTDRPPPSMRQLWTSVLGHELVHCRKRHNGEPDAARWEARIVGLLREAEIE